MTIQISAADLATLVAGGTVSVSGPAVVVTPPVVTPPKNPLLFVIAQNGLTPNWLQDYSYALADVHAAAGGNGNANCVECKVTGQWGGFQPSNMPGVTTNFKALGCTKIRVDLKPTVANQQWSIQFLKAGDTEVVNSTGGGEGIHFPRPGIDPLPVVGQWATYEFALADLMTDYTTGSAVDVSTEIYKGAVQDQTGAGTNVWYLDNFGGVA